MCDAKCEEEKDAGWKLSVPSAPVIPVLSDLAESWSQITDVYELLARAMLAEEGSKILTDKWEDALGAAWAMWNHARERAQADLRDPGLGDLLAYLMQPNHPISAIWTFELTTAAFDPGANPSYYSESWQADPQAGNKAYAEAVKMAHLVIDGDPSKDDITYGRKYYADAFADGRKRERTAFWNVWGSLYDSPTDPHLTIPELRLRYGPRPQEIWNDRK
jgi:hypothetical protein